MITQILREKIEKYNIAFSTLSIFFQKEKNEKLEAILKDRLNYIYLLEEDKAKKAFKILRQKIYEIKEKIENLELVMNDFRDYQKNC